MKQENSILWTNMRVWERECVYVRGTEKERDRVSMCVCVCLCVLVWVCVCVLECIRQSVCACVCVCVVERGRGTGLRVEGRGLELRVEVESRGTGLRVRVEGRGMANAWVRERIRNYSSSLLVVTRRRYTSYMINTWVTEIFDKYINTSIIHSLFKYMIK